MIFIIFTNYFNPLFQCILCCFKSFHQCNFYIFFLNSFYSIILLSIFMFKIFCWLYKCITEIFYYNNLSDLLLLYFFCIIILSWIFKYIFYSSLFNVINFTFLFNLFLRFYYILINIFSFFQAYLCVYFKIFCNIFYKL